MTGFNDEIQEVFNGIKAECEKSDSTSGRDNPLSVISYFIRDGNYEPRSTGMDFRITVYSKTYIMQATVHNFEKVKILFRVFELQNEGSLEEQLVPLNFLTFYKKRENSFVFIDPNEGFVTFFADRFLKHYVPLLLSSLQSRREQLEQEVQEYLAICKNEAMV
ncbi:MAG: hypothetical protein JNM41_01990 [Flavipsychrobacter sp.]|nr:hypothetical protein [Flavipsychrobacter sp.]